MKQEITAQVVIVDEAMDIFEKVVDGYVSHEEGLKQLKQMETEQELEDAANNWIDLHYNKGVEYSKSKRGAANPKSGFIAGAKWQKEQSATDAIEFAKWTQQNDWWYIDEHDYWMEGKWFDTELERFPSYTSKQLYELWQQSKDI